MTENGETVLIEASEDALRRELFEARQLNAKLQQALHEERAERLELREENRGLRIGIDSQRALIEALRRDAYRLEGYRARVEAEDRVRGGQCELPVVNGTSFDDRA